jgi:hypothetical protein
MRVMICPSCGLKGRVPDDYRRSQVRCPKCRTSIDLETPSPGAADLPAPFPIDGDDLEALVSAAPPEASLQGGAIYCPHCRGKIEHDERHAGKTVCCPYCSKTYQAPLAVDLSILTPPDAPMTAGRTTASMPREPWYYGFIEVYTKVGMWLSFLGLGIAAFVTVALALAGAGGRDARDTELAVLGALGTVLVGGGLATIGILVSVAFILLIVDVARNVRAIRYQGFR